MRVKNHNLFRAYSQTSFLLEEGERSNANRKMTIRVEARGTKYKPSHKGLTTGTVLFDFISSITAK
jgi:hypothetical protein